MAGMYMERHIPSQYILHRREAVSDVCESGFVEYYYPKNDLKTKVLEFEIEGNSKDLLVPSATFLKLKLKLVCTQRGRVVAVQQKDGEAEIVEKVPDYTRVSTVNNILGSLFESVEVKVANTDLTKSERNSHYISYFAVLLNYGKEAQDVYFRPLAGWVKDTAGSMEEMNATNEGWAERRKGFHDDGSHSIELVGKISSALFFQPKVIPTQISMRVLLKMNSPDVYMMYADNTSGSGEKFDVQLEEAMLMVQKITVVPGLRQAYNDLLLEDNAIPYFLNTPYVTHYGIEKTVSQYVKDNLFQGRMPIRIILGMVATEAFHGRSDLNPFNFQDFGLNEVCLYMDGMPYPRPPIKMDVAEERTSEAYHHFLSSLNGVYSRIVPNVTQEEYRHGYFLISYNMAPDQFIGSVHPSTLLNAHSNIRLEMRFKQPLRESVTLLVYYEYEHVMEIHKDRRVTVDF
jgi:hypothetical protein